MLNHKAQVCMDIVGSMLRRSAPSRLAPRATRVSVLQAAAGADAGGWVRQQVVAHLRAPQPAALVAAPAGARRYADDTQAYSPDSGLA